MEESLGVRIKKKRSRIQNNSSDNKFQQVRKQQSCYRCGREAHSKEEACPASEVQCRKCDRIGHYGRVCKSKEYNTSNYEENNTMIEVEEMFAFTSSSLGKTVKGDPTQEGLSRGGS